jgi:hypothetical protein
VNVKLQFSVDAKKQCRVDVNSSSGRSIAKLEDDGQRPSTMLDEIIHAHKR